MGGGLGTQESTWVRDWEGVGGGGPSDHVSLENLGGRIRGRRSDIQAERTDRGVGWAQRHRLEDTF